ncbi:MULTISPECIES: IclR family transcriptional regulator [Oceanobacillus]|uniref:IclR family transcriptional regulator n=1 Tax=Oceanobacillus kimchii TaxID=746691 RepID=A0ABQ5TL92_9BACI|nr:MULTISPECIES: IclR family transcriptional regulator [Oceanobacillus]MBT2600789.1 IclR family transcriptional regulator [Oceanobacillus sp. ISL-74]MBT2650814.1 IclR family transcriptional regulator [Oceanobacillus sp. ISL-73]MCT1575544.1 IclR family transcriptional regulator [Oceanobacillus kimchii]MCT2137175.1 IclR family transcriptional regulator [Oceanobacillus kimchii]OEH55360.1 IclR family transcriptional regulator [Oceanobacillus sp. E9]
MSVKSAKRALDILDLLARYTDGLSIKNIGDKLELPQSSTFNLLKTLHNEGYVRQDGMKLYYLGEKLIPLGTSALESLNIHTVAKPYLTNLMKAVKETVFMAMLSKDELVYIAKMDADRSIRTTAQPGYKKPIYCTGLGKTFLSFMPEREKNELLNRITLKKITANTITDRTQLEDQLQLFQKQGYSVDDEENEDGLYCLAAPIFDSQRQLLAAISVAGPKDRMIKQKESTITNLKKTAQLISNGMGYV